MDDSDFDLEAPDLTFSDEDDDYPVTPLPCGASVYGERLGHCPGCYGTSDGCCRTFYGIKAWDKHHVINRKANTRRCRTDDELIRLGMVKDGPADSWRFPSTPIDQDPGKKDDQ